MADELAVTAACVEREGSDIGRDRDFAHAKRADQGVNRGLGLRERLGAVAAFLMPRPRERDNRFEARERRDCQRLAPALQDRDENIALGFLVQDGDERRCVDEHLTRPTSRR